MSKKTEERAKGYVTAERLGRCFVLLSAIVILYIEWSVLHSNSSNGYEMAAALLLILPLTLCIFVVEGTMGILQFVRNRH